MDKQIKITLPQKRYSGAPSTDLNEPLYLSTTQGVLSESDRYVNVDLAQLFAEERKASETYRIYGKFSPLFSNAYTGTTTYPPLLNTLYLTQDPLISGAANYAGYLPYDEFAFIRRDVTRDVRTSGGTYQEVVGNFHQEVFPREAMTRNWNHYLTYVSGQDSTRVLGYTDGAGKTLNWVVSDGLPIHVRYDALQRLCICECVVEHGLSDGDYVLIQGLLYKPVSLGSAVYGSEKTIFNIPMAQISGVRSGLYTFKRVKDPENISETTSQYYLHQHSIISGPEDFVVDKCGFENSIFEDQAKLDFENPDGRHEVLKEKERGEVLLIHYKKALNRLLYTNNKGVPITEVYLTTVLRNGQGFFTLPKLGYSFHFHDDYADAYFSGDASGEKAFTSTPLQKSGYTFQLGNALPLNATLTGALVEYNKGELSERIVSEALHKFTLDPQIFDHGQTDGARYAGASPENPFGYFYRPHQRISLRTYSSYLEESPAQGAPDVFPPQAIYFEKDKVWRWRELYDQGFVDDEGRGTDFPFINGAHYAIFHQNFYVRSEYHYAASQQVLTPFLNRNYRNECE
jgi:hypothetical protein